MAAGDGGDALRPGYAAVERRLESVERDVSVLKIGLTAVQLEQTHARELFGANFKNLDRGQELLGNKLDQLVAAWTKAQTDGAALIADPTATVAGRAILAKIAETRKEKEDDHREFKEGIEKVSTDVVEVKDDVAGIKTTLAKAAGAVAVIMAVLSIVGPVIAKAITLALGW